jgi:hypothetical protein
MKKIDFYGPYEAVEMCLVPDIMISKDYKVPQFKKFIGSRCRIIH